MKFSIICATLLTALQANIIPYNYYQGNGGNEDIKSQLVTAFKGLSKQDQDSIRNIASGFGFTIPPTYYHGFYPSLNQWGPNEANTFGNYYSGPRGSHPESSHFGQTHGNGDYSYQNNFGVPNSFIASYYGIDTSSVENFFKSFGQETEKGFKNLFGGLGVKFSSYYQSSGINEGLSKEDRDKIYQEFMKLNEEERKDVLEFIVLIATSLPEDDQSDSNDSYSYYSGHGFRSF
ncbi:hypothetical protein CONCODRAFT_19674 [Conidiobolus coronatus NRRL 28638]|uniref:Uncharacterized protein n=1 Tax=Conidiobolus coronatus (strain ATCC 28846 / CBS 209.66 / NRRL 28638) TaxID=796925 RepID=A0A137NXD3_CONC2|nr:hypothetical protein CONCODRAFT_19674 [Conidiobolus coronatus NRRL 28638]|eukprot:KXN67361.1 hypothetical protein CONCODRAFT_19674 [Conidiobolus coronatus NRRL 28638]